MRTITYLILALIVVTQTGCEKYPWDKCEIGEGDSFEEVRNFENFHTFVLDIPAEVQIIPDTNLTQSKIVVFAQENVNKEVITSVRNGVLSVSFNKCFKSHKDIVFKIYTPWLQNITLNTASRVSTAKSIYGEHFTIIAKSGTNINISCVVDSINTQFKSAGNINIDGYASRQVLNSTGSGKYMAPYLVSDSVLFNITGSGYSSVYSVGYLIGSIDGNSILDFNGEDSLNLNTQVLGSGTINDLR
ncbi:MAG: GIN domain-containing protein [Salibacteraceae bacterium]